MKVINYIALIISTIGCANWGPIGLFNFSLIDMLFGTGSILSRVVCILVGICGIYQLSFFSSLNSERQERIRLFAVRRRLLLFVLRFIDKAADRCCAMSSVVLLIYENLVGTCSPFISSPMEIQHLQDDGT